MSKLTDILPDLLGDALVSCKSAHGEISCEVRADALLPACQTLRDHPDLAFAQLSDLCAVDYQGYTPPAPQARYAVVYHLLSLAHHRRLRVSAAVAQAEQGLASVHEIWPSANWYEREAFDLYGIVFHGHPDLRRLLTDYGFIGHPMRKDFPLSGEVEVEYDAAEGRVVYRPVSIPPRVLVPRTVRDDPGAGSRRDIDANTGGENG